MKRTFIICLCFVASATTFHINTQAQTLSAYLHQCIDEQQEGFLVMAKLIDAVGLCDSFYLVCDNDYDIRYQGRMFESEIQIGSGYNSYAYAPSNRYYGFTLFAEPDAFWATTLGKAAKDITADDVKNYITELGLYNEAVSDDNYPNPSNVLYKFVTYHLLPMNLRPANLVYHANERGYNKNNPSELGIPVMEFYATMGAPRLLKIYESNESDGIYLNRFPQFDNGRYGTCHELSCAPDKTGVRVDKENADRSLINATVYPIDGLLAYDDKTRDNLLKSRFRFDVTSLFPELMSNEIRLSKSSATRNTTVYIPSDNNSFQYLDGLSCTAETKCVYYTGYNQNWGDYQGDEMVFNGRFDATLRLPPVPANGIYELRIGTITYDNASLVQVFFGNDKDNLSPLGMPINFMQRLDNTPSYYWESDTDNEEYDALVDLGMRQHNVMKYPQGIGNPTDSRSQSRLMRRILGRMELSPDTEYYIRFKSLLESSQKQFTLDFIELCPKEVYANPYVPEDIW